jgi:crotonobetainyl-CoA:carnitine CoA-transferase CaiB-like acyl-CoA transferase
LIGIMSRLGEPGQPPIYLGMGSGDAMGGMMAAFGIMLALYARQASGVGQFLDASLYGAQLFMAAPTLQAYLATGEPRYLKQQARRAAQNALWNRYQASDKWLVVCAHDEGDAFERFCEAIGAIALVKDPRFASANARRKNTQALTVALDEVFAKRTAADWTSALRAKGIAASPIGHLADLADDPQAWANRYFMKTRCDEVDREVTIRGMPVTFEKTPGEVKSLGPVLGQDTELILTETLGYSWDDVSALKTAGAIL